MINSIYADTRLNHGKVKIIDVDTFDNGTLAVLLEYQVRGGHPSDVRRQLERVGGIGWADIRVLDRVLV